MKLGNFEINHGDRVTIRTPQGQLRSGKAVSLLFFANHCVLNMGGKYGTPAVADQRNIVAVKSAKGKKGAGELHSFI